MKRWLITQEDGTQLKLYYSTLEEAQERNKNCTIEAYTDNSYMKYIEAIIERAEDKILDYRCRELLKLKHNAGYILVRLALDAEDNTYYDYLEYQVNDNSGLLKPITFTMSDPKEFYGLFLEDLNKDIKGDRISYRQLNKIKPTKFYNKNNVVYWIDKDGYIYYACKHDLPNKKSKEEYKQFKGNAGAILVRYDIPLQHTQKYTWFNSFDEFAEVFKQVQQETPTTYSTPRYEIVRRGYKSLDPVDRRNIFRFPYFAIEKEIRIEEGNKEGKHNRCARKWAKMLDNNSSYWGEWYSNIELLDDVIKQYMEYISK